MKRFAVIIVILLLSAIVTPVAYGSIAQQEISISIDGVPVQYPAAPIMKNDTVMVPMRAIFEQLGAEIVWDPEKNKVTAYKGDRAIVYYIGEKAAQVNGEDVQLKTPGLIHKGTSMIPIRFVAEALGAAVKWDEKKWIVQIASAPRAKAKVVRVLDGMYVELKLPDAYNGEVSEHVRLAGLSPINNGMEATSTIKGMLPVGALVEVDIRGKRDRNLNLWADVYTANGTSVNRELIAGGYATFTAEKEDPYMKSQWMPLQSHARSNKFGLWGTSDHYLVQPIKSASLGSGEVAIVTEQGQLWVWGQFYEKPTKILDDVAQVELDSDFGVALKQDGTVWVWGFNNAGQWGNGAQEYAVTEMPRRVEGLQHIVSIESNHLATMAIDDQGTVYAWGSNYQGKIGKVYSLSKVVHPSPFKLDWHDVKDVEIGFEMSVVLKNDGTVWKTQTEDDSLAQVKELTDIESIATNSNNAVLAIKKDGTVWGWDESEGMFFGSDGGLTKSPAQIPGLSRIVKVAMGDFQFFAINDAGELYGWGENDVGQLGSTSLDGYVEKPTLITLLTGVKDVKADSHKSLFIKADGTVWGAGRNPHHIFGEDYKLDIWDDLPYRELTQIVF